MQNEEINRRSRWMIRAMEWDDPRARYPNIWHEGMPRHILAFDRVASRLRIGDLVTVYYPPSQRHAERAEKFLGLSRVVGLRLADQRGFAWIDLETEHRFQPALALKQHPRRVFLCCDPGWPGPEVQQFRAIFDAAVAAGWKPRDEDLEPKRVPTSTFVDGTPSEAAVSADEQHEPPSEPGSAVHDAGLAPAAVPAPDASSPLAVSIEHEPGGRMFAGVGYSGDMRDPRDATWLAILVLQEDRLKVTRLEATGRHGLQNYLRDPDRSLMDVEAIGLDFPFGLPTDFAESILGGSFPEEGWWALAKKLEKLSRPKYLVAVQEFRDEKGEIKRLTDEKCQAPSPLHRSSPDLGPMTYHGIRMIAEGRSRFAVRPFESAQGKLLLEVYPGGSIRELSLPEGDQGLRAKNQAILTALSALKHYPLRVDEPALRHCMARRDALEAVIAARCAALAVLSGEADRSPDDLAPENGERVRREGWIYGLEEPA